MGRHGKPIVGTGGLRLHINRFMGKMGEMGVDVGEDVWFLCPRRDV